MTLVKENPHPFKGDEEDLHQRHLTKKSENRVAFTQNKIVKT